MSEVSCIYRNEKSKDGWSLDVLKSALQKSIRRSDASTAIYTIRQCDSFKALAQSDLTNVKRIITNFAHRLQIICLEDIGPSVLPHLGIVNDMLHSFRNTNEMTDTNVLRSFLRTVCALGKSRNCSHYRAYYSQALNLPNAPESPLLREHLVKAVKGVSEEELVMACNFFVGFGKRNREAAYWGLKLGETLKGSKLLWEMFRMKCMPENIGKMAEQLEAWWKECKHLKEAFLFWMVLVVYQCEGYELESDLVCIEDTFCDGMQKMVFEEYVYDMHTRTGKKHAERGTASYFARVSSIVWPTHARHNAKLHAFYNSKKTGDVPQLYDDVSNVREALQGCRTEREAFGGTCVRAQLVTSNHKTDTYYAHCGGVRVFVKGPYLSKEPIDLMIARQETKRDAGLNTYWVIKVELVPDMWESVPLGLRKKCKPGEKAWFAVCEDICMPSGTLERSSKLWPLTQVVDMSTARYRPVCDADLKLGDDVVLEYIKCVVYRTDCKIGDLADRNILFDKERRQFMVVDEDGHGDETPAKLAKFKREMCINVLRKIGGEASVHLLTYFE